jgi:hypothetical protein
MEDGRGMRDGRRKGGLSLETKRKERQEEEERGQPY